MHSSQSGSLTSVPNGRLIDFEIAEIRRVPFQDSLYLWVRGRLPAAGFEANLAPRVYHHRPEYWAIEVAAVVKQGASSDAETMLTFEQSIPLTGIIGTCGIVVIGASEIKQIELSTAVF